MSKEDIWDEFQWEAYLSQQDRHLAFYMQHLHTFMSINPPPPVNDKKAVQAWEQSLKDYLVKRGWYFDDAGNTSNDYSDPELGEENYIELDALLDSPQAFSKNAMSELSLLRNAVLEWSDTIPGSLKESNLVHFCASINQIYIHLGKGYGFGFEKETLGGNIACTKRALLEANQAMRMLPELKRQTYMSDEWYSKLSLQLFESRNQIALYLQDLRDRFNLQID